ncbi:uncharacterized protein EI97DRAFT_434257 [Westerdykella ornata]|uniref:Uncharacterized protein n=1 Tax=Westerdykella ornata TaxID=318751 RepID=A0A6A6JGU0_WESOR|nr:uncharacterized protein EI97DRAFT_434257 [Westerdykella ornata]KAF2275414.1 hypothetical protein EI97DRAFT_434257 [Westerdykella ornata]
MAVVATANAQSLRVWTGVRGGQNNYECTGDNSILVAGDLGKCFDGPTIACWQLVQQGPATLSLFAGSRCSGQELFDPLGSPIGRPQSQFKTYHSYRFNRLGKRQENSTEDLQIVQRPTEDRQIVEKRQQAQDPSGQRITFNGQVYTLGQFLRHGPAAFASISELIISSISLRIASGDTNGAVAIPGGHELDFTVWDPAPQQGAPVPNLVLQQMWRLAAVYANAIGIWNWQLGVADVNGNTLGVLEAEG